MEERINQVILEFAEICRREKYQERDIRVLLKEVFLEYQTNVGQVIRHLSDTDTETVCKDDSICDMITDEEQVMCVVEIPEEYLLHIEPDEWQERIIELLKADMEAERGKEKGKASNFV